MGKRRRAGDYVPNYVKRSMLKGYHKEIFQLYASVKRNYDRDTAMRIVRNFIDLHLPDLEGHIDDD
jgi:hypothetical protein